VRGGLADGREGRPPFLYRLAARLGSRRELLGSALGAGWDLVAIAIVLDVVAPLLIFRQVHPGAALGIGPVLIARPLALARSLATGAAARCRSGSDGR
jgi:hypothetical protein